jgi:hypothetical protein
MLQAVLTLLCMVLVISALSALLDMLPALSQTIINAGSISLFEGMRGPLEGLMDKAFTGASKNAGGGGGGRSASDGNNLPGRNAKGVEGAVSQLTKMLTGGK